MSIFKKFLSRSKPVERTRVCSECGMPVEKHKQWCSIVKNRQAFGGVAAGAEEAAKD